MKEFSNQKFWKSITALQNETDVNLTALQIIKGVNLDIKAFNNETPLHIAAHDGKADICKLLLKEGSRHNISDVYGVRPEDFTNYNDSIKTVFQEFV